MADTKQSRAVAAANALIGINQQLVALMASIDNFVKAYNSEGYSTVWSNLPTCAQNADGSLGTADSTPTSGHPINTATIPALLKAVPATQLVSGVTMIEQLQNFFGNVAVTTGNYRQTLDDLAN